MDARAHFQTFAAYNRWANRRLYEAASVLNDAEFRRDVGAFFGSLCGALNHILVADRVWMRRIEGDGLQPKALDEILCDGFAELRAAREAEDERIIRVIDSLPASRFDDALTYTNMKGDAFSLPLTQVLTHVFNHQTHHRGQAHHLVGQLGQPTPVLDFVYFLLDKK